MGYEQYELSPGWTWATIAELAERRGGGTPSRKKPDYFKGNIPWITVADLPDVASGPATVASSREAITEDAIGESAAKVIPAGSVIFATRVSVGKVGIAERSIATNQDFRSLLPGPAHDPKYIAQYLSHVAIHSFRTRGTTIDGITAAAFDGLEVPLPPVAEQRRIVAKIEALFEENRTARAALDRIPPLLEKFRQSVLASAFRGHLTRDWREQHPDAEPASLMLDRIGRESRPHAKGIPLHRAELKGAMIPVESEGLDLLPGYWTWSSIGQLFEVSTGGTPSRKKPIYWNGTIPWVSSGEVAFSRIRDTREKITEEGLQKSNAKVHPAGTVLLAMIGEGRTRGQPAILEIPASTNQNVAAILCAGSSIPPEYVFYWFRYRYDETRSVGEGGAQPALNAKKVRALPIPLPPIAEQIRITERLAVLFAQADAIEATVEAVRPRADKLEQSILARAFRGELVPQDPNDESASLLLECTGAETRKSGTVKKSFALHRKEKKRTGMKGMGNL